MTVQLEYDPRMKKAVNELSTILGDYHIRDAFHDDVVQLMKRIQEFCTSVEGVVSESEKLEILQQIEAIISEWKLIREIS